MVYEAWRRGILAGHLPELRAHYQRKRDTMSRALAGTLAGQVTWEPPRGGFFLWVRLKDDIDAERLLPVARAHAVIYVVGSAFFVDGRPAVHAPLVLGAASGSD